MKVIPVALGVLLAVFSLFISALFSHKNAAEIGTYFPFLPSIIFIAFNTSIVTFVDFFDEVLKVEAKLKEDERVILLCLTVALVFYCFGLLAWFIWAIELVETPYDKENLYQLKLAFMATVYSVVFHYFFTRFSHRLFEIKKSNELESKKK